MCTLEVKIFANLTHTQVSETLWWKKRASEGFFLIITLANN